MSGRLAIENVTPVVGGGAYPAKAVVGERLLIGATVWREGHEAIAACVHWRGPGGAYAEIPMSLTEPGTDRWHAVAVPGTEGPWTFQVVAWSDPWTTWQRALDAKLAAGHRHLDNELESGARLLDRITARHTGADRALLQRAARHLRDTGRSAAQRAAALTGELRALAAAARPRELVTQGDIHRVQVERPRALFSSWYELFPRSTGGTDADGRPVHGTLRTAARELDRIAAMGFDVVYLPPVHPIGTVHRKGRDNALTAGPDDVGSPWAIGSADGGHDALHPALGTLDDFGAFITRARELGLEVALDLALQCAPDHPWLTQHPEWFTTRPDGSIAHAENPPKSYEDIHPLDFDQAPGSLFREVLRIVRLWMARGVRAFRVDNPHTKPPDFWERLISTVQRTDPDVLFLAEAFTRPAVLEGLAARGFSQSYTYFTWRTTKQELTDYLTELVAAAPYLRPNFWPTTPDILPAGLHHAGPAAFAARAALAATLSPSWGVYSGYELCENVPLRPDSEEFRHSEKYELRPRDFAAALRQGRSLEPWLALLNRIRRAHPALQQLRTLRFHPTDHPSLIAYSKTDCGATGDAVLCVVSLDPEEPHAGTVTLDRGPHGPLEQALAPEGPFTAVDEVTGEPVRLGPAIELKVGPEHSGARIFAWRNS